MFEFLEKLKAITPEQWADLATSLLAIFVGVIIARLLIIWILDRLGSWIAKRTDTKLDDRILLAIRAPIYWLILIVGFGVAIQQIMILFPENWEATRQNLFYLLQWTVVTVMVWRIFNQLFIWYGEEMLGRTNTDLDNQLMPFLQRITLAIVGMVAIIIMLSRFQIDVSGLVTTLGVTSLAIALAAQATLEDTINGFLIIIDRPFRIGDRIEILALNTWGDVVDIGLRSTRIQTLDNRTIIVPNSVIGKSLVVNHTYPSTAYRIQVNVGVAYGTDLDTARQTIIEAIQGVEGVLTNHPIEALFMEFGDSALVFRVRWWIHSYRDTEPLFDKVNTRIYKALNQAGIQIPFPQRDVHHKLDQQTITQLAQAIATPNQQKP